MSVLARLRPPSEARAADWFSGTLAELLDYFVHNGNTYPFGLNQTLTGSEEKIENSFQGYVNGIYKRHGPIASCMVARRHVFSQLRYLHQKMVDGRPQELYHSPNLTGLERPWRGGVTSDLNSRMIDHADLAGNSYVTRTRRGDAKILRPDWVTILIGGEDEDGKPLDPNDVDAELVGYMYAPPHGRPRYLRPHEVVHFAPEPDPIATYRGMSWITPVLRNVMSHSAATDHKQKFFTNGATPNMVLSWDKTIKIEQLKAFKELFEEEHKGVANAYKTMFLGGGASPTVVGQDFKQLDFKTVQGTDETLIAAAAGVPPVIAGLSEGLAASTYSNYGQAKKQFADTTIYHLGQNAAASLEILFPPSRTADRLWFDMRDIPFFRDDAKAEAEVHRLEASMLRELVDGGWDPETVKQAVISGDWSTLTHTGKLSVQLQKPGEGEN